MAKACLDGHGSFLREAERVLSPFFDAMRSLLDEEKYFTWYWEMQNMVEACEPAIEIAKMERSAHPSEEQWLSDLQRRREAMAR